MTTKRQRPRGTGTLYKRVEGGPWIARWYAHDGKRKEASTRTTDKAAAERILSKRLADTALRKDGVIDARLDAIQEQARRPISEHLDDYEAKLSAGGRTETHIQTQLYCIRQAAECDQWNTIGDVTADGVNRYAGSMKQSNRSAQTIRNHLAAIKSFVHWLFVNGKLSHDPLVSVKMPNAKADRKRKRRMLLHDEWEWLRLITIANPDRYSMTGQSRMLLYATAIQTGLRSSELRSLSRGNLFLANEKPYITCSASNTKNRKDARQYIQNDLADELREYVATKAPRSPVFAMPPRWDVASMLRDDLADARREWLESATNNPSEYEKRVQSDFLAAVNHEGEHLDFHALRHTCGAWLAMTGAHVKAVQSIMRHSSITLTMDTYGHLFPGQEANTVSNLPNMLGDGPQELRATGTADVAANAINRYRPKPRQLGRETVQSSAATCDDVVNSDTLKSRHLTLQNKGKCDNVQTDANNNNYAPGGIRTHDPRFRKPVLYPTELRAPSTGNRLYATRIL